MTTKKESTKKPAVKKTCLKCSKEQVFSNFYSTTDTDYYEDGKLPICKGCCQRNIEAKGFEGFQALMRMINKPIYDDLFKGDYFEYVKNINSLPQYRSNTFLDSSLFKDNKSLELTKRAKPKDLTADELREAEDFFGLGFSEQEYIWLNSEFEDYGSQFDISAKPMQNLIREICLTQLDIRNKRTAKQDVKNELKTLQDLLGSSNLKPMQETGAPSIDQETFGTLIKKWEDSTPIPDDEMWKDTDTIGKYLKVWFTGHLMRMFSIENKDEEEYYAEINKYTVEASEDEGEEDDRT